jgi:protein PhnA
MSDICELCGSSNELSEFSVSGRDDESVVICSVCKTQIESGELDENHFNCLNDSMWSERGAVKVLTFRLLSQLSRQDLLDMIYLEDDEREWAESGIESGEKVIHKDANGVVLSAGDTVVVTKDLDVKGTSFVAKRGTAVRNIALVKDNAELIEGRVNGVKIQILTKFLKKS